MKLSILLVVTVLFFSFLDAAAQDKDVTVEATFFDLVPPVAVALPVPKYPKDAKKSGLGGPVSVGVSVDAGGAVTVLDMGDGPYPVCSAVSAPIVLAIRMAAVEAAKKAKFTPATPTTGRLIYNFKVPVDGESSSKVVGARAVDNDPILFTGSGTGDREAPKTISGGVLNGKANSLPVPTYPPAAKAVRASGAVAIQILIYEDGSVFSARAVNGHPLLRKASETDACNASFTPTLLVGHPVKVSGIITYVYNP